MLFKTYTLDGSCKKDFDTEIRFDIASARYDGCDLVMLSFINDDSEEENTRLLSCITRVLSSLKKAGNIKFFVKPSQMLERTTEAEYIVNKFPELTNVRAEYTDIYVKL